MAAIGCHLVAQRPPGHVAGRAERRRRPHLNRCPTTSPPRWGWRSSTSPTPDPPAPRRRRRSCRRRPTTPGSSTSSTIAPRRCAESPAAHRRRSSTAYGMRSVGRDRHHQTSLARAAQNARADAPLPRRRQFGRVKRSRRFERGRSSWRSPKKPRCSARLQDLPGGDRRSRSRPRSQDPPTSTVHRVPECPSPSSVCPVPRVPARAARRGPIDSSTAGVLHVHDDVVLPTPAGAPRSRAHPDGRTDSSSARRRPATSTTFARSRRRG